MIPYAVSGPVPWARRASARVHYLYLLALAHSAKGAIADVQIELRATLAEASEFERFVQEAELLELVELYQVCRRPFRKG